MTEERYQLREGTPLTVLFVQVPKAGIEMQVNLQMQIYVDFKDCNDTEQRFRPCKRIDGPNGGNEVVMKRSRNSRSSPGNRSGCSELYRESELIFLMIIVRRVRLYPGWG